MVRWFICELFLAAEQEPELQIILHGLACSLPVSLRGLELQTLDWRALNTFWGESERRRGEKVETKRWNDKMGADAPLANTRRKRRLVAIY